MPKRHILVCVPRTGGHCRDMIRGVFRYQQSHADWELHLAERPPREGSGDWDGCVYLGPAVGDVGVPVVDLSNARVEPSVDAVREDGRAAGRMAGNFFLDQGHRHFGFAGLPGVWYSEERLAGFREAVEAEVAAHAVWVDGRGVPLPLDRAKRSAAEWLAGLPKPCAVLAASDSEALFLVRLLNDLPLEAPEDVSILGVDNDDLICRLPLCRISSVALDGERIGFEAARRLEARMADPGLPARETRIPPKGVVVRESTASRAVDDPEVRRALAFIRREAHCGVGVPEVARAAGVNRRTLEIKFRRALDDTVLGVLRTRRLERAKRLLRDTGLPVKTVAAESGFHSAARFAVVFKELTGMTPGEFRAQSTTDGHG